MSFNARLAIFIYFSLQLLAIRSVPSGTNLMHPEGYDLAPEVHNSIITPTALPLGLSSYFSTQRVESNQN